MTTSPPQEASSPRSVGSSGSDSDNESKVWKKISKIIFSMLEVGYLYQELGPKSIIDRLKSDETNSTLRSHVTRIRYLAKVLQHFDDVREPAAQPLIHALAYQTINYLQARAYTLDEDHKSLIFSILHEKKNRCDLTKIRCIAKSNIDPSLWDKDYETIETFFFGKALQLPIDRKALNPGIESDLAKGQKLMLLNRFCRIHNISVCKMSAASPVQIYIESDPSKKMKPVPSILIEVANLYNKEPHIANLVRLWEMLTPYFLCLERIRIYTNIPDINTASIQFCDFHVEKFISILHFYRNTFDNCPRPCKPSARAAANLMQQWYTLAAALSVTDSCFDKHLRDFFNAWWGFAIEDFDFPALTLQLQKHYPEFLCHRKHEYPTYDDQRKLSELAFSAHEMLKYLDIDNDYDSVLHSSSTIFTFSTTARLFLDNRCSIDHEKIVEALSSAYYASSKLNISKVQTDSWIYNFKEANCSKRATFIRESRKYLTLLSQMPNETIAYIGMIDFFSAYYALAHDLPNDPLPEFTNLIPQISTDLAYENKGVYFDALRHKDPFEDSLANTIKTLHVLKVVQAESPIAKAILQDFPNTFKPILERKGPFDNIDKQLTDHFASLINNLKENKLTLSNSELRAAIRPIAFLWIEILRNTTLHHISDFTDTDRERIFQQLNELIEFCTPPVETDPISGLVEVAPWTFSILKRSNGNKIYNTDAPFARYINRILIQFIKVRPLSSSDPLVNHYISSFAQNLNRDISWISLYHKENLRSLYDCLRRFKTKKLKNSNKHLILALLKKLYLNCCQ